MTCVQTSPAFRRSALSTLSIITRTHTFDALSALSALFNAPRIYSVLFTFFGGQNAFTSYKKDWVPHFDDFRFSTRLWSLTCRRNGGRLYSIPSPDKWHCKSVRFTRNQLGCLKVWGYNRSTYRNIGTTEVCRYTNFVRFSPPRHVCASTWQL